MAMPKLSPDAQLVCDIFDVTVKGNARRSGDARHDDDVWRTIATGS